MRGPFLKTVLAAKAFLRSALFVRIAGAIALLSLTATAIWCLVPVQSSRLSGYPQSWLLYARDGRLIREVVNRDGARATWVDIDSVSPWLIDAIVAIEDKRFYSHHGIDLLAAARSTADLVRHFRPVSGASTITMQAARVLYKCPHSAWGKYLQCVHALRLERTLSKKEILGQYCNRVHFGPGCVGVEAAARRFFGKSSHSLTVAEAAFLAALPQAPTIFNPLGDPERAVKRQRQVLAAMHASGIIGSDDYRFARAEPLAIGRVRPPLLAMHFTDYALSCAPKPGRIVTTLDLDLEGYLEKLVADHVASLSKEGLTNAAVVVLDNKNGDILAMVGSSDYWSGRSGSVNGAVALRQPGSTLKPFTYAMAFESGKSPATVVADIETEYIGSKGNLFSPRNYSHTYSGPVLMRDALGRSLNVPAIRTLNYVGIQPLLDRLRRTGFGSLKGSAEFYGLGLTLGNGEVSLLELAQGFSMFARGGLAVTARFMPESGSPSAPVRVFSEQIAYLITDILSDDMIRIQAFGAASPLLFDFPFALKTGTSANWRDSWAVGYSQEFTVAVWAGDFEGAGMNQISGTIGAGPLFNKVVRLLVYGNSVPKIPVLPAPPPGVEQITVCPLSGLSPGEYCPSRRTSYVLSEKLPRPACDVHRTIRIDRRNGLLASDCCPSRYVKETVFAVLPSRFAAWQAENGSFPAPPHTYSPLCPQGGITANALVITSPRKGERFLIEPGYDRATQTIALKGESDPALPSVSWELNGSVVAKSEWPYTASWRLARGKHSIRMSGGGRKSEPVEIEVQ